MLASLLEVVQKGGPKGTGLGRSWYWVPQKLQVSEPGLIPSSFKFSVYHRAFGGEATGCKLETSKHGHNCNNCRRTNPE